MNRRTVVEILLGLLVVVALDPGLVYEPSAGLDPAWKIVLGNAIASGAHWGRDFVFTYGPLGDLSTRVCTPGSCGRMLVLSVALAITYALTLLRLHRGSPIAVRVVAIAFTALILPTLDLDAFYFHALLLFALDEIDNPSTAWMSWKALAVGCIILSKLSFAPLAIALALVVDGNALRQRRRPFTLLATSASGLAVWLLVGQRLSDLPGTLHSLVDILGGYGDAMSLVGPTNDLTRFAVASLVWIVLTVVLASVSLAPAQRLPVAIALALTYFMSFKAGFTRHDYHSTIAWQTLALNALFLFSWIVPRLRMTSLRAAAFCGGLAAVFVGYEVPWIFPQVFFSDEPIAWWRGPSLDPWQRALALGAHPWGYVDARSHELVSARGAIPPLSPLSDAKTVDSTHWSDAPALIAAGVYAPRPIPIEYCAWNARLQAMNTAFFAGDNAPEELRVGLAPIDNRYPASAEGASWPALLAHYAPSAIASNEVVLKRRAGVPSLNVSWSEPREVSMRDVFMVAGDTTATLLSIDVHPTLFGRLLGVLYKRAPLILECTLTNGRQVSHRVIPGLGAAGFLASPYVADPTSLAVLWAPPELRELATETAVVETCALRPDAESKSGWSHRFVIRTASLDLSTTALDTSPMSAEETAQLRVFAELARSTAERAPKVVRRQEGLFAHAPTRLTLATHGARNVQVTFGMADGSWVDPSATDGVDYLMRDAANDTVLWSTRLDPLANEAHRSRQTTRVSIPKDTQALVLETACGSNCNKDASFWYGVVLEDRQ